MRRPRTRLHGNHSTSQYLELVFVSLFRATAYCLFIEQRMGVGHICAEYGAVSDRADVDRPALVFVHEQGFIEIIRMMSLSSGVSLFRAFSLSSDPLERAIKSPSHKEQPKETRRRLASTGLLQGSNAGDNTERYGSTKDVAQEIQHGV